jgi:putative sulfotransferase
MDRFVVGTGRCGSTLLSKMLAEHPAVLSLFEFFNGLDMTKRFGEEPMHGAAFAQLISQEHPFVTMVLRRGYEVDEIVYPFGPKSRYQRSDGLPWILVSTLSRLSDDPDPLFDETVAFAATLPRRRLAEQYRALFDWLAQRLGKRCWIERSGSSIDYAGSLHKLYPDARFLHIHRDGHETALSMREHAAYRLAIGLMFGLLPSNRTFSISELQQLDPGGADDTVSELLASRPPVEYFGRYWSQELVNGYKGVAGIPPEQYREVRFEDLVANPREELQRIAEFFALPDGGGWTERAAALVRGVPPARFGTLSAEEQERLAQTCRQGMELLHRV